jgi:dolichol-phosphate mannosyltransferase
VTRLLRFAGFGAAGASGVLPNLAVMWLLSDRLGAHYLPAAVAATEVAIVWNFFRRRRTARPWWTRFGRFALLNNLDLAIRLPLLALLVTFTHTNEILANLATLVAAFALRYAVTDRFIYRAAEPA